MATEYAQSTKNVMMASIAKITKMKADMSRVPVQLMVTLQMVKLACTTKIVLMASFAKVTKMKTVISRLPAQRWTMFQLMTWTMIQLMNTSQVATVTTLVGNITIQEGENGAKISVLLQVDK